MCCRTVVCGLVHNSIDQLMIMMNDNRDDDDDDADDNNVYERHDGYYNVSLPVLLSKRDLVKMITKDSTKLSLK